MTNWAKEILILCTLISSIACNVISSNGCSMEGISSLEWTIGTGTGIYDIFSGNVFERNTEFIDSINSVSFNEGLNAGPYFTVTLSDNRFVIATNDAFRQYEERETAEMVTVTVNFRCGTGSSETLVIMIVVTDTNNNPPIFLSSTLEPTNEFVYTLSTPIAPGTMIPGCNEGITVRDIDLTTERIEFTIEENPYLVIEYDENASSNTPKQFIGILKTKSFIRSIPEPITLRITATDVDRTADPPITTTATITISGDTEFEFPEEPVFSQTFYLADYTKDNQLILAEEISLQRGYDELVQFRLIGDFSDNFALTKDGNRVSVVVYNPLPADVLREKQIFLVLRADREYTSGDSAAIVVRLPEEVPLEFQRAHYEGTIESNTLRVPQLILTQGYEGELVNVEILGDFASFFTPAIQGNMITISMGTLTDTVINENNMIPLEIVASTEFSRAGAVVTLEIIKDDNETPVFNRPMYSGSYDTEAGLTLEQIVFDQGYDETVDLSLGGEHRSLFTISTNGLVVTLTTSGIPPEMFSLQRIELTLQATKPRTVGATAVIIIDLPAARQLSFEESSYKGILQDNVLSLQPIDLSTGYDENVVFSVTGEHATYFQINSVANQLTVVLRTQIPETVIQENNIIILRVEASGFNAITATTTILLDIIKEDTTTPVFSSNVYYGNYQSASVINIENINLAQGFANDVTFELRGEHAQYFQVSNTGNNVVVTLQSTIPTDVIFDEKVLLFNIVANKPLTVGANAAISIQFPSELTEPAVMRFVRNTYQGVIENNAFSVESIILSSGYESGTEFLLSGELSRHFTIGNTGNDVSITLNSVNPLPIDEIEGTFIILEVEARRGRAVSAWTSVVIGLVKGETQSLVFTKPYYQGVYVEQTDELNVETISLAVGYDETVVFQLEGDQSQWFRVSQSANTVTLTVPNAIPAAVLANNQKLVFVITAKRTGSVTARSTVVISLGDEDTINTFLGFGQITYVGSVDATQIVLPTVALSEGYTQDVVFSLHGDLSSHFVLSSDGAGVVRLTLPTAIPDQAIPANRIISLQIRATAPNALGAHATIVLEAIVEDSQRPQLVFNAPYYTGSYTTANGLSVTSPITLAEGYDDAVVFSLEGEQSQWFRVSQSANTVTLTVPNAIPAAVLANNRKLLFVITAQRTGSVTARSTVVISLGDEDTINTFLGFGQFTYVGSVDATQIVLPTVALSEGYTQDVVFSLHGDLSSHFVLSSDGAGVVRLTLPTAIPDQAIPANRIISLQIRATAPNALAAHATIVLEAIVEDSQRPQLVFNAPYYTGSYTTADGLSVTSPITLAEGYDDAVVFSLEGEQSQWFRVSQSANTVALSVPNAIPAAVLANNRKLVFVITAQRTGSVTARSTVVISLGDEDTINTFLGFGQITYVGSVDATQIVLPTVALSEGYTQDVVFSLHGDLSSHFVLSSDGAGVVRLTLPTAIPDQAIPANRIISLQIRATAPNALAAHATIVLEAIVEDSQRPQLVFNAPYYTGSYTTADGLSVTSPITLAEGYDDAVVFSLEGEQSQWFRVSQSANTVTLSVPNAIPAAVLANNRKLVFVITAQRTGSVTARSTVVISLGDEDTINTFLGFGQITYVGSVDATQIVLPTVALSEGYTQDVVFSLHGDLSSHFVLSSDGAGVVRLTLPTAIPDQAIPANRIISLQIRATAPNALAAHATIVLEAIVEDSQRPQLVFNAPYYTGSYTTADGLSVTSPITLAEGYDDAVVFSLEGEQSQWFRVSQSANTVTLSVPNAIPAAVLANNRKLVFVITAQRTGSVTARSTVVISLGDEDTINTFLGFGQITYVGSVDATQIVLPTVALSEGYTQDVVFSLHGDLSSHFVLSSDGAGVVRLTLPTAIPDQAIPANRIISLQIRATAPNALAAHATIVLEAIVEDSQRPQLVFNAPYYTGSYTTADGLSVTSPITLAEGYDDAVVFSLEGEQSQWFRVSQSANTVTLSVPNAIPAAVLANNRKLVFVITAQRTGSVTARSTVVISLGDEDTINTFLGFGQFTYVGSVDATQIVLPTVALSEGYTQDVVFSLHGDLSSHFVLSSDGAGVVRLTLPTAIPDQAIPANRIISLQIRATAPNALAAHATIVLEAIVEDSQRPQLVFNAPYYTGSYTTADGLSVTSPITLAEGYDDAVVFSLEGEQSQWLRVSQSANTVALSVPNAIPAAVLANNRKLVFVITAQRTGSVTARSTVVISLGDEDTINTFLGFGQITYVGSVDATQIVLPTVALSEGYTQDVVFSLHGDLSSHFVLSSDGAGVVRLTLPTAIPDQAIPANRIISLQIRATAPNALAAHATIVLEAIVEDSQRPQLVFNAPYYTGSYTTADGLSVTSPITLAEGYDDAVVFSLEGEQSQWFRVSQSANTVTLSVPNAIPAAVLANNRKLVFVITAQRTGSVTARSTVVISLGDEDTINTFLGFGQITYVGSVDATQIVLPTVALSEGYTQDVVFSLHGDLSSHFVLSSDGAGVVRLTLPTAIPDQAIPANRIISLQIRATAPNALAAHATIVLEAIVEDSQRPQLVFNAPYYTGSYTTADGLSVTSPITLAEGYDDAVVFSLEGEQSQWFRVSQSANTVALSVPNAIPAAVLANNRKLVFVITAQRTGSVTARSTVVISLGDEDTINTFLGFGQITYVGSVDATQIVLPTVALSEGYTQDVVFSLHGDLSSHFVLSSDGAGVVRLTLPTAIPDQAIPANRIISLQIRATAPNALAAHATIVLEAIVEDSQRPQLVFNAPYYTGSYTTADGLSVTSPITLAEGYDDAVVFSLEGEQSQWFRVSQSANTVALSVPNAIPAAVLANNRKLVFVITAQRTGSVTARSTVVISLGDEDTINTFLGFGQITYVGSVDATQIVLPTVALSEGYTQDVVFSLHGDLSSHFVLSSDGAGVVRLTLPTAIPDQAIPANRIISLQIRATAPNALAAHATIVLEAIVEDSQRPQLVFNAPYYTGSYTTADGLSVTSPITLAEGYDDAVVFSLEGEQSQWFRVSQSANTVTLSVPNAIPAAVLANNRKLVFVITAQRTGSVTARSTVVISLGDEDTINTFLGFGQITYVGSVDATQIVLPTVALSEGYTQDVVFSLHGDLSSHFVLSSDGAGVVRLTLPTAIPDQAIPANRIISLQIRATAPNALAAHATIVLEAIVEDSQRPQLVFNAPYYTGSYTTADGLSVTSPITLAEGYDDAVVFSLEGEQSQWFRVSQSANTVTLSVPNAIPAAVLANNRKLVFVITAQRTGSVTARSTVVISLGDEDTINTFLGFGQITYVGSVDATQIVLPTVVLSEGYTQDVVFSLHGDLSSHFVLSSDGAGVVRLTLPTAIPDQAIPANRIISLQIRATAPNALAAHATIVLEAIVEDSQRPQLVFNAQYYTGSYTTADGLSVTSPITVAEGYDDAVVFSLEGEQSQWFRVSQSANTVTLSVPNAIPAAVLANNRKLVFVITAQRTGSVTARSTVIISLEDDLQTGDDVSFGKLVYEGIFQLNTVQHELISISNSDGVNIQLHGEYASLFVASISDGVVSVQRSGSLTLPDDVTHLVLEMHASRARAVLLLNVVHTDVPVLPSVTFSSSSYILSVEIVQTGLIGRVLATADNDEAVAYSLDVVDAHLLARVSINNEGELHLSAAANSGVYTFTVIATTVITRAQGKATVYLTVEAVTICGDDEIVVPPLIILNRDEEQPHLNLVTLNNNQFPGCFFTLSNRWPLDQNWLYVDSNGLHARSIDREHESIAFMALSQVQVELVLHCANDNAARSKRSLRTDLLGPYDYGSNKWILTESIPYNARRSLVNLIVNDINDNAPIFVGKELEPIAIGYPIGELEERILPRALAELQATDADIGENAALMYLSDEDVLAVEPTTGSVHVRSGAQLQNDQRLIVKARDQNGKGLTGEIQLLVKLLDLNNIVVVTVKDAFLGDERALLLKLSEAVGYEVKVLKSVVVSEDRNQNVAEFSKNNRDSSTGASLLLYTYGMDNSVPVVVDRLTEDINNNAAIASVISTISLEDHLEPAEIIISERDIGLLVATIVLSVLLFIIIVLIAIWFFLRWRKNKNYDEFTDENSIVSRNESIAELPNPVTSKPRLNIEDLKKSEKRLQDMLNAPIEAVTVEAMPKKEAALESVIDLPTPEIGVLNTPIFIQSIDKLKNSEDSDEDEFGEKSDTVPKRRKSVVTFNENVEKIIHLEDDADSISSQSSYEIYRL